jgi:uncharacterized membrane protein YagU involved in acid resistance
MLFGRLPKTLSETIYALLMHFFWVGALGAIFAFFIRDISSSRGLLGKGVLYGITAGFIFHSIPVLFGVQFLEFYPLSTNISDSISGIIWGFTMAYTLIWLDKKYKKIK